MLMTADWGKEMIGRSSARDVNRARTGRYNLLKLSRERLSSYIANRHVLLYLSRKLWYTGQKQVTIVITWNRPTDSVQKVVLILLSPQRRAGTKGQSGHFRATTSTLQMY